MPERLSNIKPKVRDWKLGGRANRWVSQRPRLARLAMEAISSWSNADHHLRLGMFVQFFGGQKSLATDVFLALDGSRMKSLAIEAVVKSVFTDPQEIKLFKAIQDIARTNEKQRDKLAHWIWGISDELPDALLLSKHVETVDDILVYKERDFLSLIEANERLCSYALGLRSILMQKDIQRRSALFQTLSKEPEILEKLNHPA